MLQNDRRSLVFLLALTLLVRGGVLVAQKDKLGEDIDAYLSIAEQIAVGNGFADAASGQPTAYRPPLYPLILAAVFSLGLGITGIAFLQLVLGIGTVYFTWRLGTALFGNRAGYWAAVLLAIDPLLVQYSTLPMTETLSTFLAILALNFLVPLPTGKRLQFVAGLVIGLCILSRPTFLVFLGLLSLIWFAIAWKSASWRAYPWAIVLGTMITVMPWMIRNQIMLGRPKLTTTHGGYTLLLGNNPVFYREVVQAPWGTVWNGKSLAAWQESLAAQMKEAGAATELERDRFCYEKAKKHIRENPRLFFRASFLRFVRFWNIQPPDSAQTALHKLWIRGCEAIGVESLESLASPFVKLITGGVAVFYLILIGSFLGGILRMGKEEWSIGWPLLILIASFCAVHLVYWSNARMRAPVMPAVALMAVRAWMDRKMNETDQNQN